MRSWDALESRLHLGFVKGVNPEYRLQRNENVPCSLVKLWEALTFKIGVLPVMVWVRQVTRNVIYRGTGDALVGSTEGMRVSVRKVRARPL